MEKTNKVKIIITKRVSKKMRMLNVVSVSKGYFRNYLKPQGYAIKYSSSELERVTKETVRANESHDEKLEGLNGLHIFFGKEASTQGVLYGSVTKKEISEEIKKSGFTVSLKQIEILGRKGKIDRIGSYDVEIDAIEGQEIFVKVFIGTTINEARKLSQTGEKEEDSEGKENLLTEDREVSEISDLEDILGGV